MKKALILLLILSFLFCWNAQAQVEKSPLLDAALSALEKDNIFLLRYNEFTGSSISAARKREAYSINIRTIGNAFAGRIQSSFGKDRCM